MKISVALLSALILSSSVFASSAPAQIDARENLGFTDAEKVEFLSEMRQMLVSIQGVISGIAEENPEKIIQAAKYSGNRMARNTPMSIKRKTSASFKQIGGPTHMMFEELAIRAETDDMQTLTEFTGELMQQCVACHAIYKVN
ncbi:MAG: hypothetical protein HOL04_11525 [Gammaproteobacteria bacterium]|jgi:hypothetical protein|nr:hypothetical protein [Gammaproteobacteria bacterium]MBT4607026.1 hypothetical protein [Thiotrichales bacterium]MBT3471299.1 hypothetical protein [Gammaproteobacteria bacterium]MBT3968664.1 hypothetical protein [Gammaproteobacteria bacterium]MBT4080266.1 hypothetical protein [Gammaproteobacteria bacterium]